MYLPASVYIYNLNFETLGFGQIANVTKMVSY